MLGKDFKNTLNEWSRLACKLLTMNTDFHLLCLQSFNCKQHNIPINKDTKGL